MPYLKLFLVILRVPGILLVDIWWQNELNSIIPKAFDIEEIADSGLNFLPAILVSLFLAISIFKYLWVCVSVRPYVFNVMLFIAKIVAKARANSLGRLAALLPRMPSNIIFLFYLT